MRCELLLWVMIVAACLCAVGCTASRSSVTRDPATPSLWRMTNGTVELTVDLAKNRISSYQFVGGRNVLWVNPAPEDVPADSTPGPNWGGDRVWVWPQRYWNWPPPLPAGGYQARAEGDRQLVLTSGRIAPWNVRAIREIELAAAGTEVTITTRLEPIAGTSAGAGDTRPIAPWSVTQVVPPKRLLARIPRDSDRQAFLANTSDGFVATAQGDALVELRREKPGNIKTFVDADTLIVEYDDLAFTQRSVPVHHQGTWAPTERCQLYQHANNTFLELEWTSPMLPPQQVAQSPLRVIWSLQRR